MASIMRFRLVPVFLIAPIFSSAQVVTLEPLSVAMQDPSRVVTVVELTTAEGAKPSVAQWSFEYDGNQIDRVIVQPGEAAMAAGRRISCSSQKSETTCILWGLNRNAVADGVIAKATFFLNRSVYSGLPISMTNVSIASGTGDRISSKTLPTPVDARPQFNTARHLRYFRDRRSLFVVSVTTFLLFAWALYQIFKRTRDSSGAR